MNSQRRLPTSLKTESDIRKEFEKKLRKRGVRIYLDKGYTEYMKFMGVNMKYHSLRCGVGLYFDFKTKIWKARKLNEDKDLHAVVHTFIDLSQSDVNKDAKSTKSSRSSMEDGVFGTWTKTLSKNSENSGFFFGKNDSTSSTGSSASNQEINQVCLDVFDLDSIAGSRGRHEYHESVIRFFEVFQDAGKIPEDRVLLRLGQVNVNVPSQFVRAELTHSMVASSRLRRDLRKRAFFFQISAQKQLLLAAETNRCRMDWIRKLKPQSVVHTRYQEIVQMYESNTNENLKTYVAIVFSSCIGRKS